MAFELKPECQKAQLRDYFVRSYDLYERLFDSISNDDAYYKRPEPLRHPLIFYLGHTAVVYINKAIEAQILSQRIDPKLEAVFAVGVNEMDWDDLTPDHYDWPTVQETKDYRLKAKQVMLKLIDKCDGVIEWESKYWGLLMGVEHELIHLDTSAVIIRRLEIEDVQPNPRYPVCSARTEDVSKTPSNLMVDVPAFKATINTSTKSLKTFCWDNQIGEVSYELKSFCASKYLVSNGEFLEFVKAKGYQTKDYWTQEGWHWCNDKQVAMPLFWVVRNEQFYLRTLAEEIKMPWDWPVIVNHLEADAFCVWKSKQTTKQYRLPTEGEFEAMAATLLPDAKANLRMEFCASEMPVDSFEHSSAGLCDVVGNVWQHMCTVFFPYKNFTIHPFYEDYSSPCFDNKHNIMRGGSWINQGAFAQSKTRNYFRRHFYQFAGFRYVCSQNSVAQDELDCFCDEALASTVRLHYIQGDTYLTQLKNWIIRQVESACGEIGMKDSSCLVVGCAAGRLALELTDRYEKSVGLDCTSRFFRAATLLQERGVYILCTSSSDNGTVVEAKALGQRYKHAEFYQQKLNNIDTKKFSGFDLAVVDNFALQDGLLLTTLREVHRCLKPQAYLVVNSAEAIGATSHITQSEIDQALELHFTCLASTPLNITVRKNQCEATIESQLSFCQLRPSEAIQ